jgi:serine O-acetyltransferase
VHAQVLGPFRVGDGARIGAQAVVLSEVPDGATMVGIPAKPVARRRSPGEPRPGFQPYALGPEIPDPIARALNGLLDEVTSLRARLSELEKSEPGLPSTGEQTPEARGNGADDKKRIA